MVVPCAMVWCVEKSRAVCDLEISARYVPECGVEGLYSCVRAGFLQEEVYVSRGLFSRDLDPPLTRV